MQCVYSWAMVSSEVKYIYFLVQVSTQIRDDLTLVDRLRQIHHLDGVIKEITDIVYLFV